MNRFVLLAAMVVALSFAFATPAFAGPCDNPHPPSWCPQPEPEPEPTTGGGSNTNTNTNTATGGSADVGNGFGNFSPSSTSLAGAGVFGSGNSSSDSSAKVGDITNKAFGGDGGDANQAQGIFDSGNASQGQGQQQGLVGIQGQLGILDNTNDLDNSNHTKVDTDTSTSTKTNQGQDQTAVGKVKVDSHDELTIEGDDIVYEAPDIPVNSAAPVFAGACSQGVSIQTQSFGGSAGTTNPVCDYVAVAGGFIAAGDRDDALRVLHKAEGAADWRYRFSQIRSVLTLGLL
jgi:hypothetical protein